MKKNTYIVFFLTVSLVVTIFLAQRYELNSDKPNENLSIGYTTKQAHEVATHPKMNVLKTDAVDVTSPIEETQSVISEEALAKELASQKQTALDRVAQLHEKAIERRQNLTRHATQLSFNEDAKKTLNIDMKKDFNVDFDAKFEEIRNNMRQKNKPDMDKRLADLGVAPDMRRELFEAMEGGLESPAKIDE